MDAKLETTYTRRGNLLLSLSLPDEHRYSFTLNCSVARILEVLDYSDGVVRVRQLLYDGQVELGVYDFKNCLQCLGVNPFEALKEVSKVVLGNQQTIEDILLKCCKSITK